MTPAARIAAAIEVLDQHIAGMPAEQALTTWARRSRFAGSGDRAAVRDHVFDVLRAKETASALGQGKDGRALMIGLLRHQGLDPRAVFTGEKFAPSPLDAREISVLGRETAAFRWNLPEWLVPVFEHDMGAQAVRAALALTERAPVTVRVNKRKATRIQAQGLLARDGVTAEPNDLSELALTVTDGARKLRRSQAYTSGVVELQDAASQAVVDALPEGKRCLDYCAGGGGKALGLAAQPDRTVIAHDIDTGRMRDIPPRAERADVKIEIAANDALPALAPFDLVLCDAPCSGSGAWRRSPEAKWSFTEARLSGLCETQQRILEQASDLVSQAGTLVYATCSMLQAENERAIERFLQVSPEWKCAYQRRIDIGPEGDGFYSAHLKREGV